MTTFNHLSLTSLVLGTVLIGCAPPADDVPAGISIGGENGNCETVSQTEVTDRDAVIGPFTATPAELLAGLLGEFEDDSDTDSSATPATLALGEAGTLYYIEQQGRDGMELACASFLAIEVDADFTLDETTLDESATAMLRIYGDASATFQLLIMDDEIAGDIAIPTESAVTGETPTSLALSIRAGSDASGSWSGDVKWLMEFEDGGSGDDASVSTTNEPVQATWIVNLIVE